MTTLHLGVIDAPYTHDDPKRPGRKAKAAPNETTADVAEILEAKYEVMGTFWRLHGQEVADEMTKSLQGALENLALGAPPTLDPTGSAMQFAMQKFRDFLTNKEMDGVVGGVPTKASLDGTSHRFKNKKGAPGRPSFVDTGLFEASFQAWLERT